MSMPPVPSSSQDRQEQDKSMVIIRVEGNCNPTNLYFKIRRTTPMRKMMEAYCHRCTQTMDSCKFELNGVTIQPEQTAEQLEMSEGCRLTCTIDPDDAEKLTLLAKRAKAKRQDNSKLVVENQGLHECMVCAHVYWPPVLCAGGHTMCQACAQKLHDRDQPCPLRCRNKLPAKPPQNLELRRVLERLPARCTAPSCSWRGTLGEFVEVHETVCDQIEVACPKSSTCPWTGMRGQVLGHLTTGCGKVNRKCEACCKVVHRQDWTKHLAENSACAAALTGQAASFRAEGWEQQIATLRLRVEELERWKMLHGGWRESTVASSVANVDANGPSSSLSNGGLSGLGAAGQAGGVEARHTNAAGAGSGEAEGRGGGLESGSELTRVMEEAGLAGVARRLCEETGVASVSDLALLEEEDVPAAAVAGWLKPVQRRKFLSLAQRLRQPSEPHLQPISLPETSPLLAVVPQKRRRNP